MASVYRQRSSSLLRFLLLVLCCLSLMALDQKRIVIPRVKSMLALVVMPLEYAAAWPSQAFFLAQDYFKLQRELVGDKRYWQSQSLLLKAQLQQMRALELENQHLKSLLGSSVVDRRQAFLLANILAFKTDGFSHELLLDRGASAKVSAGQAVVASDGIVGQVIEVNPFNAKAMLLTDTRSAIPVINQRSQENAIVIGIGEDQQLSLMNVSSSADFKVGDVLVSSGMGGHYPAGFAVGTVSAIQSQAKDLAQIQVKPAVALTRLQFVIIPLATET